MDVAAGGEVSGEGRGFLPHFASAAGVGVVGVIQGIVLDDPEALREQNSEQHGGDLLRAIEAELPQAVGAVRRRVGRNGLEGQSSVYRTGVDCACGDTRLRRTMDWALHGRSR